MDAVISSPTLDTRRPIAIAVMAMGGQGGGVLVDWIVALIEGQGWLAQSTSVPGVAQRTGATIYYVEAIESDGSGRRPVLSLMPVPGEVDIVIGAELMEAGRAMQRGLVSPDRTTLIASSHRAYAVSEKIAPGDGAGDPAKVHEAARAASKQFLAFDMAAIAEQSESVISAALFGALAASGALPFPRAAYEATIREAGVGVEASLRAFGRAYDAAVAELKSPTPAPSGDATRKEFPELRPIGDAGFDALVERARKLPEPVHGMVAAGLARVVDFQDVAYGREYLDRVECLRRDVGTDALTSAAAKQIARAMAYDDVIRVADLKTRDSRFARMRAEVAAKPDQIVYATEFMHPRMEEVCGTLPAGLGLWIETSPRVLGVLRRLVDRGRRVRTGTIGWFLTLYLSGGPAPLPPRHAAPSPRAGAYRGLARARAHGGAPRRRACGRNPRGAPAGQRLLGHPRRGRRQILAPDGDGREARRPRRCGGLDAPPAHRRRLPTPKDARSTTPSRPSRASYDQQIPRQSTGHLRPGARDRGPSRSLSRPGAVRAGDGASLRQHLDLCRPRQPGAEARRLLRHHDRRAARHHGARHRGQREGPVQSLPAQGHAAHRRDLRQCRPLLPLPLPCLDLPPRRQPGRRSAEDGLRRHGLFRRPCRARHDAGAARAQLPRLRLRQAERCRPGLRGVLRPGADEPRQHDRPLAGRAGSKWRAACCATCTTAIGRCWSRTRPTPAIP